MARIAFIDTSLSLSLFLVSRLSLFSNATHALNDAEYSMQPRPYTLTQFNNELLRISAKSINFQHFSLSKEWCCLLSLFAMNRKCENPLIVSQEFIFFLLWRFLLLFLGTDLIAGFLSRAICNVFMGFKYFFW